jgi:hypothetical protein
MMGMKVTAVMSLGARRGWGEEGMKFFFLLNDASSKRIRQQRMAQEDQRGACLQPSTAERTVENETAA